MIKSRNAIFVNFLKSRVLCILRDKDEKFFNLLLIMDDLSIFILSYKTICIKLENYLTLIRIIRYRNLFPKRRRF